jgi:hypothetical protein
MSESSSSDSESKNSNSSSENNSKRSKNKKKKNDESLGGNNIEEEQLINYYSYIDKCMINLEENRQNYVNNLEDMKSKINDIKTKKINNFELTKITFDECIKLLDEHYSLFTEANQILLKFNELNDSAQNMHKYYKNIIYCNDMHEEVKEELQQKIQENEHLRSTIKELKKMKNNEDEKEDNILKKNEYKNNTEMKSRMNNLIEENNELKRKYSQVMSESKLFKDYVEQKYISKQESTRRMSTLLSKLDSYENEIGKLQNKINEIEIEKNNNEIIQNEDEKENILDNHSYLSENSSIKQGINLEDLLENEEEENENFNNDNKLEKKSINNKSPKSIKKHKNSDLEKKSIYSKSPKSIKKHKNLDLEKKSINSKSPKSIKKHKNLNIEKKSNLFILCPMSKMEDKKKKLNNLKIYKSPFSHISCSSYTSKNMYAKKKKNSKSVKSIKRIDKDKDKKEIFPDKYKIFFCLLLKSIIMNNKIIEYFKNSDYENLYEECKKEEIPFNQYQEWILNKINLNDKNNDDNNIDSYYYDDSNINNCFICTSMI